MTVRTLAEAAAEVLARSKSAAPADPTKKLPSANWQDLGGSTLENPAGDSIGTAAASAISGATAPGKPAPIGQEPMKKLAPQPQQTAVKALVNPPAATPSGGYDTAGHPVASFHEEEELEDDEIISEDEEIEHIEEGLADRLGDRIDAAPSDEDAKKVIAKASLANLHHVKHWNMGLSGTRTHKYMKHVDSEIEKRYNSKDMHEEVLEKEELSEEELAQIREAKYNMVRNKMKAMGCKEDIDALFNGQDVSEDFHKQAEVVFEAAVIARAVSVVEELENDILAAAEESVDAIKQELEEQIDSYLNYMVEQWVQENEVAIETGLKTEIMESLIGDLKTVFENNYIEVPETKIDVMAEMAEEIEELNARLNEALNDNIELAQAVTEAAKSEIVSSFCEGLTATQSEKVKTLAEGVEFTTEGEYADKVKIIRESYFTNNSDQPKVNQASQVVALTENNETIQVTEMPSTINRYYNAISRTTPR